MKVTLKFITDPKLDLGNLAASVSTGKVDNPSPVGFIHGIESGHYSLLEHYYMTFLIEGISRACSHQLVRHRLASYTQKSLRYSTIDTNTEWYVIPDSLSSSDKQEYISFMNTIAETYNKYIKKGIKKEDARFILPEATKTDILMSMNLRSFVEQCHKRLCNRAQWEIRELYNLMRLEVVKVYSFIANYALPNCYITGCKELKPCDKSPEYFSLLV